MNMTSSQLYLRLLGYVRPYWRAFAVSLLGMIVVAATEPLVPALMKPLLDGTFVHKDQAMMRMVPAIIILIFLVRGLATFIGTYAINWVGNKLVMDCATRCSASCSPCRRAITTIMPPAR